MKFMVQNSRLRVVTLSLSSIERDAKYSPARTRAANLLTRVSSASRSTDEAKEGQLVVRENSSLILRMTDYRYIIVRLYLKEKKSDYN